MGGIKALPLRRKRFFFVCCHLKIEIILLNKTHHVKVCRYRYNTALGRNQPGAGDVSLTFSQAKCGLGLSTIALPPPRPLPLSRSGSYGVEIIGPPNGPNNHRQTTTTFILGANGKLDIGRGGDGLEHL